MAMLLGVLVGFWCIYALIALILKHNVSIIITTVLGIIAGISSAIAESDYSTLLASIIGCICIVLIKPIQVKSDFKNKSKDNKSTNNNQN